MRGIRIVGLAALLLLVTGASASAATVWSSASLGQSIWFAGATNWNNYVIQPGGLGFPGGKYGPIESTLLYTTSSVLPPLHALPGARFGDAAVTDNGLVYAIGGMSSSGALLAGNLSLDPTGSTNAWVQNAPLPHPRVALSAAVAPNGDIYTMGGDVAVSGGKTAPSAVVDIYTPGSNSWTSGPALPITLDDTAAVTVGNDIYVFGGYHNGPSAAAYSLDTTNLGAGWTQLPNMPSAADLPGAAADPTDADGRIYVAGGSNGANAIGRVDIYDPIQNDWSCLKPMPGARIGGATTAINAAPEKLVVAGGLDGNVVHDSIYSTATGPDTTDVTAPVVSVAPTPRIVPAVQAPPKSVEVALGWTRTDAQTAILADNLQVSTDNVATWNDVNSPWAVLDPGYFAWSNNDRLWYRVSPTDCNNNTAAPRSGPQFSTRLVSEASVHYTGTWSLSTWPLAQGGHFRYSTATNAVASYTFTGRDIGWVAAKGPTKGDAYVAINGVRVATVNLYVKGSQPRMVVFQKQFTTSAKRTITIKVVGTKGHPSVNVDSLFVIGNPIGTAGPASHALSASARYHLTHATAGPTKRVTRP